MKLDHDIHIGMHFVCFSKTRCGRVSALYCIILKKRWGRQRAWWQAPAGEGAAPSWIRPPAHAYLYTTTLSSDLSTPPHLVAVLAGSKLERMTFGMPAELLPPGEAAAREGPLVWMQGRRRARQSCGRQRCGGGRRRVRGSERRWWRRQAGSVRGGRRLHRFTAGDCRR
jgi:hypothetical protein